jgi:Rrf2 family protein
MGETSVLRISEAGSLALHTAAVLAGQRTRRLSAHEIADRIHVSEAHLAKVLQRLHKAGIVDSVRGRGGGFTLAKAASRIRLLDVYEAIEGKLGRSHCLMDKANCAATRCILGGLLADVDEKLWTYLSRTKLSQLSDIYGGGHASA